MVDLSHFTWNGHNDEAIYIYVYLLQEGEGFFFKKNLRVMPRAVNEPSRSWTTWTRLDKKLFMFVCIYLSQAWALALGLFNKQAEP